jgi:hypothetical protein
VTIRGALRFGRYAFGPNRFGYCGPPDYKALLEYVSLGEADQGLVELTRRFDGAYPYLKLIAHANGTDDAFDERAVEAYWVGNDWLRSVGQAEMRGHIDERFGPRVAKRDLEWLGKTLDLERPHHNFHVFQIYRRAGLHGDPGATVALSAMDSCRISWGTVRSIEGDQLVVERQPLILDAGKLALGQPVVVSVARQLDGLGFVEDAKVGDTVSVHWDWACEVLAPATLSRLENVTARCMQLANKTT